TLYLLMRILTNPPTIPFGSGLDGLKQTSPKMFALLRITRGCSVMRYWFTQKVWTTGRLEGDRRPHKCVASNRNCLPWLTPGPVVEPGSLAEACFTFPHRWAYNSEI